MNAPSFVSSSDIRVNHVSDATRIDSALQTTNDRESNKRRGVSRIALPLGIGYNKGS